jgi:hypothetical protein
MAMLTLHDILNLNLNLIDHEPDGGRTPTEVSLLDPVRQGHYRERCVSLSLCVSAKRE